MGSRSDQRSKIDSSNPLARPTISGLTDSLIEPEVQIVEVSKPAIIPSEQGVWIGNICVTPTGLDFADALTEEEWRNFYPAVKGITTATNWIIGDYFAWGEYLFDLTYAEMADLCGLKAETVETYASICRNVRKLIRVNSLSFAHHRLVAAMPEPDQIHWLQAAIENGWSVRELKRAISPEPEPPALSDRKNKRVINRVWKAVAMGATVKAEDIAHLRRWLDEVERSGV